MAGEVQDNVWPLPKFYFSVQLGEDSSVTFSEVNGLETETKMIEYRHGKIRYSIQSRCRDWAESAT